MYFSLNVNVMQLVECFYPLDFFYLFMSFIIAYCFWNMLLNVLTMVYGKLKYTYVIYIIYHLLVYLNIYLITNV